MIFPVVLKRELNGLKPELTVAMMANKIINIIKDDIVRLSGLKICPFINHISYSGPSSVVCSVHNMVSTMQLSVMAF